MKKSFFKVVKESVGNSLIDFLLDTMIAIVQNWRIERKRQQQEQITNEFTQQNQQHYDI